MVSTTYPVPALAGDCLLTGNAYDLSKGMGWYLTGTLTLPGRPGGPGPGGPGPGSGSPTAPTAPVKQTAAVKLPKWVKRKGRTVLLRRAVVTNAGRTAKARITWSTRKAAKGQKLKYAAARTTKKGKVVLRTTGAAKRLYVRLRLSAPAVPGYTAYRFTKRWRAR